MPTTSVVAERRRAWRDLSLAERLARVVGPVIVVLCCAFVLFQLQPHLLLRDTTPAGGDMGAHVWLPAYLRDHLITHWRIAGWAPDWYAGFPAGQFYFPLPALLIVAADVVLPYNIAFKLVTALGPVALPGAAYAFGRGLRARPPGPALMAVMATAFLFFKGGGDQALNQRIMGGNLASTMAGEFSFTIAMAFALCFLGALARALDDRRRPWLPAALLAATVLSHLVVGVFAALGAVVVWLARRPWRSLPLVAAIAAVGALLTAVWTLPLVATLGYTTDMGYEPIREFRAYLAPRYLWLVGLLALVGVIGAIARRHLPVLEIALLTGLMALLFRVWEDLGTPAWNLRLLPFWYLGLFLLAGIGLAQLARGAGWFAASTVEQGWWDRDRTDTSGSGSTVAHSRGAVASVTVTALAVVVAVGGLWHTHRTRGFLDYWVRYNYTGYENAHSGTPSEPTAKNHAELIGLVEALDALPSGRVVWENDSDAIGAYGTPLALMLLPYFTDGRVASMEGLYYEGAGTTPYHFLAVAALTAPGKASNPVRGLTYRTIADFDLGVRYLRLLGVRYYAAQSADAKSRAAAHPGLERVATSPDTDARAPFGWEIYEVAGAPLVEALRYEPVVVDDATEGGWRDDIAVPWFDDREALDRPLVGDGPDDWERTGAGDSLPERRRRLPDAKVTDVEATDDSISFRVSRPGVPVLVKASYFPNWRVEGAEGPYRATPNFMVVVPTGRDVRLEYRTTAVEGLGRAGTVLGLLGLTLLAWWGRRGRTGRQERGGEGPTMHGPWLPTSTPSSRPTTSVASTPTSSTSRSPAGSATPSSPSPAPPG